jgi:hypothetical protein
MYFPRFAKHPVFLNKKTVEKQPEIRILFFNFSEAFFLKWTCTRTHDNINLFLRKTRNVENRKSNYFYLLWRWIILSWWVICVVLNKTLTGFLKTLTLTMPIFIEIKEHCVGSSYNLHGLNHNRFRFRAWINLIYDHLLIIRNFLKEISTIFNLSIFNLTYFGRIRRLWRFWTNFRLFFCDFEEYLKNIWRILEEYEVFTRILKFWRIFEDFWRIWRL